MGTSFSQRITAMVCNFKLLMMEVKINGVCYVKLKSMADGRLRRALAILCFVIGVVGRPRSILMIVPKDTPAFVARSMIFKPRSNRISFTVFILVIE